MTSPLLPREPRRNDILARFNIANAVAGLRIDRTLTVESFQLQPSIGIVAKQIDRLGLDIRTFREPLERSIKRVVIPSIRANFEVGGRPTWEPLSEATVKMRKSSVPVLIRSGKLMRGATQFNIWSVGSTTATLRKLPDNVSYGYVHQAGYGGFGKYTEAAKKRLGHGARGIDVTKLAFKMMDAASAAGRQAKVNIPQRQFVMMQDEDVDAVEMIFAEWLEERLARVGRLG